MAFRLREALRSSLLTRFTAVFIATVLLPSLAALSYSVWHTSRATRENAMVTARSIAADVFDSVAGTFSAAEDLSKEIAFDTALRDYLNDDFPDSGDAVIDFMDRVRPIMDHAVRFKGGAIDGARIVSANPTQPESWPFFVNESRMRDLSWYEEFRLSGADATWIYPNVSGVYTRYPNDQIVRRPVYTHLRKIYDFQGDYLGVVLVDVPKQPVSDEMQDLALSTIDFVMFAPDGTVLHEATADGTSIVPDDREAWLRSITAHTGAEGTIVSDRRYTYLQRTLPGPELVVTARIHLRSQVAQSALPKLLVAIVIVLGVAGLEIGTYFILNGIFMRLSSMTGVMNRVATGEFHHRIPVTSEDEMGQIAKDFNVLIQRIDDLVSESVRRETLQKDTELKALQFQINPHFIYNTVDTFRMRLLMLGEDELADGLASFGKLIRYNLAGGALFAPLADELDIIEQYIDIKQLRHDGRVCIRTEGARRYADAPVLRFLLQPIVENSVRHGLTDERLLTIVVDAERRNGTLTVTVRDDGKGMDDVRLAALRDHLGGSSLDTDGENGIGLSNIAARMSLYYEGRGRIHVDAQPDRGTLVELTLPANGHYHESTHR